MTTQNDSLLSQAYSSTLFAEATTTWQSLLTAHMQRMANAESAVLNWTDPQEAIREAFDWMQNADTEQSSPVVDRISAILNKMLQSGQNLHHPHYIGHQVPASVPIAGLFDAVNSITNQPMAVYEMGPWATAVEHAIVKSLCLKVGWNENQGTGLLTHGGSLANLTALLTARNVALPDSWENGVPSNAVLISHTDAHYCVTRAAGILGLGARQVFKTPSDSKRHIDSVQLDHLIQKLLSEGRQIIAVSSCACATPTGAFDDLNSLADVCEKHGVWLHVDAAHGGGLLMSGQHRDKLAGIERADSIVWDAHKMMFVPALCAAVLYKNRSHRFETFQQNAPYLFDPSAPGMADVDMGMRTIECTKRAVGFGLWGLWCAFGEQIFAQLVDRTMSLTRAFVEMLDAADDFEKLHEPECNIVVFRYRPTFMQNASSEEMNRFQRDLRTNLIRSGSFYIVQTTLDGMAALRACLMNPMTTTDDLAELLTAIRQVAAPCEIV